MFCLNNYNPDYQIIQQVEINFKCHAPHIAINSHKQILKFVQLKIIQMKK